MSGNFWLVKSEPSAWSWQDHVRKGIEPWTGVRNFQAAANLKAMREGDLVFFYHSVTGKEIVGVLEVVSRAYPDPTDESGRFVAVDLRARVALPLAVSLEAIKAEPRLKDIALIRQSRLSVMPLKEDEWNLICSMGGLS